MQLVFGYCEGQFALAYGSTIEFLSRRWLAAAHGFISTMDAATYVHKCIVSIKRRSHRSTVPSKPHTKCILRTRYDSVGSQ